MDHHCHVDQVEKSPTPEERRESARVRFWVEGMGCPNCLNRVRNSLLGVYGVASAAVTLEPGMAEVVYNPSLVEPGRLSQAVAAAGGDGRHEYRATRIG